MFVYWVDENGDSRIVVGRTDEPTDLADFFPTVAELAGTQGPVGMDGVSLVPLLQGKAPHHQRKNLYFENNEKGGPDTEPRGIEHQWSVLDTKERMKLIYWVGAAESPMQGKSGFELYNLSTDPGEHDDLLDSASHSESAVFLQWKERLQEVGEAEGGGQPADYYVTFHAWTGNDGSSVSDPASWSASSAPEGSWSATLHNAQATAQTAYVRTSIAVLGLEVSGTQAFQHVVIEPGHTIEGRNEIRIAENGEIVLDEGRLQSNRWVNIAAGGSLSGKGSVGGDIFNSGLLVPGRDLRSATAVSADKGGTHPKGEEQAGLIRVDGDYHHQASAELRIRLMGNREAGAEEPLYDQLAVSGQVKIQGGVLTISTSNGFKPAVGDSFRILNFGRVEGRFESIVLPPLEAGESWSLNDLYATGTIRVMKE